MPHVVSPEQSKTISTEQSDSSLVNGETAPAPNLGLTEKSSKPTEVFIITVNCPDGTEKSLTIDHSIDRSNISIVLSQICRQFNIDDDMAAIVPEHFWQVDDSNSGPSPVRLIYPDDLTSKDKSNDKRYQDNEPQRSSSNSSPEIFRKNESEEKKHGSRKNKRQAEPETVTILSSDSEDESKGDEASEAGSQTEEVKKPLGFLDKEPIITEETEGTDLSPYPTLAGTLSGGGKDFNDLIDSPEVENSLLECRTVRIGSYKVIPNDNVLLSAYGLRIKVDSLKREPTVIKILRNEIVKVLVYFGTEMPVMFYYITAAAGRKVRTALNMSPKDGSLYFDPTSSEEVYKRITLLPVEICEESRLFIKSIYENNGLLGELDSSEANAILVRAANKKDSNVTPSTPAKITKPVAPSTSTSPSCQLIQTIMIYPPPPVKGGISINTEDYACLGEDQFLNDVIIDFYLKYLMQNMLDEEDRKRTHVLSSFFYKRLTSKTCPTGSRSSESSSPSSPAEKRHARVKGWTKGVNIFAKDFIIIPINENSHWFLAIICYPGLTGCVSMLDNKPLSDDTGRRSGAKPRSNATNGKVPDTIGETTITVISSPLQVQTSISLESDGEERDEAEGTEEDVEPNSSDDEAKESDVNGDLMDEEFPRPSPKPAPPTPKPTVSSNQEPIKQPCILVFDSLLGSSRSRVIATLREYLHVEYKVKHKGATRDFSKNCVKGSVPKVPQQNNFTDCGLYVLQYVEEFFKKPILDYRMPLKLKEWFPTEIVSTKRYEIQQLLHRLMDEQGVDRSRISLPSLELHPDRSYSDDGEEPGMVDPEDEMGDEEMEEEQEEEEPMDEEDYEEEELPERVPPPPPPPPPAPVVNPALQSLKKSTTVSLMPAAQSRAEVASVAARAEAARAEAASRSMSRTKSPPRAAIKPTVMMEPTRTPAKRTVVHLSSPDAAGLIKKKQMSQRPSAPPRSPLSRISSSVEITKKKVRPDSPRS